MDRSFEDIFISALVDSLTKTAAELQVIPAPEHPAIPLPASVTGEHGGISVSGTPLKGWDALMAKLKDIGQTGYAGAHQTGTAAKKLLTGVGRLAKTTWQTKGLPGKAAVIGIPTAAAGLTAGGAIGAEKLIQALRGKKKEKED